MPETSTRAKAATKADVYSRLADRAGLTRRDVAAVFDALGHLVAEELSPIGPGVFNVPGLVKLVVVRKPAKEAREGINPFTKAPMSVKAQPARSVVKARPVKAVKEMV